MPSAGKGEIAKFIFCCAHENYAECTQGRQNILVRTCVCLTLQLCVCVPEAGDGAVYQEAGQHGGQGTFSESLPPHIGHKH